MADILIVARSDREYRVTVGGVHALARRHADGTWSAARVGYGLRPPVFADTLRDAVSAALQYDFANWRNANRRSAVVGRIPAEIALYE